MPKCDSCDDTGLICSDCEQADGQCTCEDGPGHLIDCPDCDDDEDDAED